jgi:hypothetical protein
MGTNIGPIFEKPADAGPRPSDPKGGDATKVPGLITWISKNPHLPGQPDTNPDQTYHKTLLWLVPGRAIKGSIDEAKDGTLTFTGEFSTTKHPNGTANPDTDEQQELKALLTQEKPAVDKLDQHRFDKGREAFRRAIEGARHKRLGTCAVSIDGPANVAEHQFGSYTAVGLPAGGSYFWAPSVQEDLDGLYGVRQAYAETTLRADKDSGTSNIGVRYVVGKCEARATKTVRLTK